MKLSIVFDTETTGFVRKPINAATIDKQPYMTEICCLLLDHEQDFKIVDEFKTLYSTCHWNGVFVPAKITKLTGIDDYILQGEPHFEWLLDDLLAFMNKGQYVSAHNLAFDMDVLAVELLRANRPVQFNFEHRCTMYGGQKICGTRPKLARLYKELFGETFDGAHRALADTTALARCYAEMMRRGVWKD